MYNLMSVLKRPFTTGISFFSFNVIYTLFVLGVCNLTFFKALFDVVSVGWFFVSALCMFCVFFSIHAVLFWKPVTKVFAGFLLLGNALASYFILTYNILLNKTMMMNLVETNMTEASDFFNASFFGYLILVGLIPVIVLCFLKINYKPFKREFVTRLILILLCLAIPASFALPNKKEFKVFLRENFNLRYQLLPTSYLGSLGGVFNIIFLQKADIEKVDQGLRTDRYWQQNDKKNLIVFVLGESARVANFSLNGYERDTNLPLEPYRPDMMIFDKTTSCGVVTRVSLPCMFSHYNRRNFKVDHISYTENVLDLIKKGGYDVRWIENEIGCSKVCRRIPTEYTCQNRDCMDEKLNERFKELTQHPNQDSVYVLHQRGSHGTLYHKRYPKEFERYTPVCKHSEIGKCKYQDVVNAYDNTIYYTSFLLADLMAYLTEISDRVNPVLIYVSDHGESLGENKIMLHGGNWDQAPAYQKEVPFFVWMPASSRESFGFNQVCLADQTKSQKSHDYIFHSLLGLSGVFADVYNATLDIFAPCRETSR